MAAVGASSVDTVELLILDCMKKLSNRPRRTETKKESRKQQSGRGLQRVQPRSDTDFPFLALSVSI